MTFRTFPTLGFLLALAAVAGADAILLKDGTVLGFPAETKADRNNWRNLLDKSTGKITSESYGGLEMAKKKIPLDTVEAYEFTSMPDALQTGLDDLAQGNYPEAIASFQEVLGDQQASELFRVRAEYEIGRCYIGSGNNKTAEQHFSAWKPGPSKYTPVVYDFLAQLQVRRKAFDEARASYASIEKLPEIPKSWVYSARLGAVGVSIEERKFPEAEAAAKSILAEVKSDPKLNDQQALALVQIAKAIQQSDNKARLPEAQTALEQAAALPGVEGSRRALLYSTLGDVIYMQGRPEEAREPYMRVVCIFQDEPTLVAHALRNAGQCYIDLYQREDAKPEGQKDPEKVKRFLCDGMPLLQECFTKYRGNPDADDARRTFQTHRKKYDELK